MSIAASVIIKNDSGDREKIISEIFNTVDLDEFATLNIALVADTKTQVRFSFSDVNFLYVETDGVNELKVYKNAETTYWTIGEAFLAFDISASAIYLEADENMDVKVFAGGT